MLTESFKIIHKEKYSRNVLKLELVSPVVLPEMKAVSFVKVHDDAGETRTYAPSKADARSIVLAVGLCPHDKIAGYLDGLSVDDHVKISVFEHRAKYRINEHKNVLMVCWGMGIVPMFQILDYAVNCRENETKFTLLFFNREKKDVFLCDELKARKLVNSTLNIISVATGSCDCESDVSEKGACECESLIGQKTSGVLSENEFDFCYVAGPPKFVKIVGGDRGEPSGICTKAGMSADRICRLQE